MPVDDKVNYRNATFHDVALFATIVTDQVQAS